MPVAGHANQSLGIRSVRKRGIGGTSWQRVSLVPLRAGVGHSAAGLRTRRTSNRAFTTRRSSSASGRPGASTTRPQTTWAMLSAANNAAAMVKASLRQSASPAKHAAPPFGSASALGSAKVEGHARATASADNQPRRRQATEEHAPRLVTVAARSSGTTRTSPSRGRSACIRKAGARA